MVAALNIQFPQPGPSSPHDFYNWALNVIITPAVRLPSSVVEQLTCNEQVIRSIRMGGSSITPLQARGRSPNDTGRFFNEFFR